MFDNITASTADTEEWWVLQTIWYRVLQVTLLTIAVLLSIVANGFSIIVIRMAKQISDATKVLMYSLAFGYICQHLFYGIPLIGSTAIGYWPYGPYLCFVFAFGMYLFNFGTLCTIFALNIDRYIAVSNPLRYQDLMTENIAAILVTCGWAFSLIFCILNGFLPYQAAFYKPDYRFCFMDPVDDEVVDIVGMLAVLLLIVVPILASVLVYRKLIMIARHHVRQIAAIDNRVNGGGGNTAAERERLMNRKSATAFLLVTVGFVVSWILFIIAIGYEYITHKEPPILPWFANLTVISGTSWNVFIYYWKNEAFRRPARKLIPRRWRRVNNVADDSGNTASSNLDP